MGTTRCCLGSPTHTCIGCESICESMLMRGQVEMGTALPMPKQRAGSNEVCLQQSRSILRVAQAALTEISVGC